MLSCTAKSPYMSAVLFLRAVNGTPSRPVTSIRFDTSSRPAMSSCYDTTLPTGLSLPVFKSFPAFLALSGVLALSWYGGRRAWSLVMQTAWFVRSGLSLPAVWSSENPNKAIPARQTHPSPPPSSSTAKAITAVGLAPSWGYLQLYVYQTSLNDQIKNSSSSMCLFSKSRWWNHQIIIALKLISTFDAVLVIFPQSNLKNRRDLEYSPIGAKFPPKIAQCTLNTVKKNFNHKLLTFFMF